MNMEEQADLPRVELVIPERYLHYALIGISVLVGINVHAYYDWTRADQSYAPPIVFFTGILILVALVASLIAIPFLPIGCSKGGQESPTGRPLSIRMLLIATTAVAALLVLGSTFPVAVAWVFLGCSFLFCVLLAVRVPRMRWGIASLIATLYCPFLWIVGYAASHDGFESLPLMFAGLPGHLPLLFLARFLFEEHPGELFWLATSISAAEICLGLSLLYLGIRRSLAFQCVLLTSSILGSFILDALLRA